MTDKNNTEYLILKSLNIYYLDTEMLANTIGKTQVETEATVKKLFAEGFIDRLSSSSFFVVFPELRSRGYRNSPPSSSELLTTTRKGYFETNPITKKSKYSQFEKRICWKAVEDLNCNTQAIKNDSPVFTDSKGRNFILCEQLIHTPFIHIYKPIALAPDKP
jgi:hypothetical protein